MASVLIVDDSNYARRVHRGVLEAAGHTVRESATGLGAIESYSLDRPDVVLLDLSMEDVSGVEVLRMLREMDKQARVIVCSADVQRSTTQSVLGAGAERFLSKPASADQLVEAVNALTVGPRA